MGMPSTYSGCCCYHKGRNFQANHNIMDIELKQASVVVATTKVGIFKQITTSCKDKELFCSCCCYHKGRNFQANHNNPLVLQTTAFVVVATTKVGIFKQITTFVPVSDVFPGCCCYHKGRNFQANHNVKVLLVLTRLVVVATTKVGIFKQITTRRRTNEVGNMVVVATTKVGIFKQITTHGCFSGLLLHVVVATTKVGIFKQITTAYHQRHCEWSLLLLPQR